GNGQTELVEALTGMTKADSGTVQLKNKNITNLKPRKITEMGVGHIPQDRQKYGLVLDYSIRENLVLQTYGKKPFSKHGILNADEITKKAAFLIAEYDVRTQN